MADDQRMTAAVPGRYFTANASHFFAASLSRDAEGLLIHVENFIEPFRPPSFERSQPLAGLPTKLTFPDGSVFEALSDDGLLAILNVNPGFFEWVKAHEGSVKSVLISLVLTIAVTFGFWRWGLPASAYIAAWITPPVLSHAMDVGTLTTLDRSLLSDSKLSDERKALIIKDFDNLVAISKIPKIRLTLLFRDAPALGPNAFALPGGSIILTDQMVNLSQNPDEIAGVLAHEIGHVYHQHSLRLIYQVLGIGFFISMISGDPGSMIDSVVQQASALQTLAYSRDFEREADQSSVALMQKLGRDPKAMLALLDRVVPKDFDHTTSFLSTHPGLDERRIEIEQSIK